MRPHVICHMLSSIDGRLHPSRFTASSDGGRRDWSAAYEAIHEALEGDAWMVGRVTMAELSKAGPHAPADRATPPRPVHVAREADSYAVAIDRSATLHFKGDAIAGDHVIVLLGPDVSDEHLAELVTDGVSYLVEGDDLPDLAAMLSALHERFGIRRLLLEGGGTINGSMLDGGFVDELSVLIVPALDGARDADGIVMHPEGLTGRVRLGLIAAETLEHGMVHVRYRVEALQPD